MGQRVLAFCNITIILTIVMTSDIFKD